VKHINDSPVYVVAPVHSDGPERTLHRDLLLPCGFLAPSEEAEENQHKQNKATVQPAQTPVSGEGEQLESYDSEEEVDYDYPEEMLVTIHPPVTVVHEIPQIEPRPPSGEENTNTSPEESRLRPEAEVFQPTEDWRENFHKVKGGNDLPNEIGKRDDEMSLEVEEDDVVQTIPEKKHGDKEEPVKKENKNEQSEEHEPEDLSVNDVLQKEDAEVRRSVRHRVEPDRLTYQTLGNPLTLVMHSLLNGLDQAFTKALDLHPTLKFTALKTDQLTTI